MNIYSLAFNKAQRLRFYKKLAEQIKFGQNLNNCLSNYEKNANRDNNFLFATIYKRTLRQLNSGFPLGSALANYIDPEEVILLEAGQKSGKLENSLSLCADIVEAKITINKAILTALAYPAFLFLMLIALICIISFVVIPQLAVVIDPNTWSGAAYLLYTISSFVASKKGLFLAFFLLAFLLALPFTLGTFTGKIRQFLDNFPPYSIYKITSGSVWLFTISTLMSAGSQLAVILSSMLSSSYVSPYLKEKVQAILTEVKLGSNIGTALTKSGYNFPDKEIVEDLFDYEKLPNFEEKFYDISKNYLSKSVEKIQVKARILNILVTMSIGVFMILLLISMSSIQNNLSTVGV